MTGLEGPAFLLAAATVAIVGLIVLIARFKLHPFIAPILASGFLGLVTGLPVAKVVEEFQDGFGGTLGFVGVLLGLGTMLGKLMAESGGADLIARTLVDAFGRTRVHGAMMISAILVGIPLLFEIGFVLLAPLVFVVARHRRVAGQDRHPAPGRAVGRSLIPSHVNDAGLWLVKQYFGLSLAETFKTWTAMETIISVVGIVLIMLLSMVV